MENGSRSRKYIAPVVITVIDVAVLAGLLLLYILVPIPVGLKVVLGIVCAAYIGVSIYVLIERINEIRSGEEDDLSKY